MGIASSGAGSGVACPTRTLRRFWSEAGHATILIVSPAGPGAGGFPLNVPATATALLFLAPALLPLGAAGPLDAGIFTHSTDHYSVLFSWRGDDAGPLLQGSLSAGGRTATFTQEVHVEEVFGFAGAPDLRPTDVRASEEDGIPVLTVAYVSVLAEVSGEATLTFLEDRILHRSSFRMPSGAFAPTLRSTTTLAWSGPYGLHGSVTSDGNVTLDGGESLDAYGAWKDAHRYGVFVSDAGGAFVGHARVAQGDMANYLNEGTFRVGPASSAVTTYFNGFLDAPTAGLAQALSTLDALVFLPDGSTPGAFADDLAHFPGFEPFALPALGDLAAQGHVVVAVADTGINPYHEDFVNPGFTAHPSTYVHGYPADAAALTLTFGPDYAASRNADDGPVWSKVVQQKLYWIPGTKVVGAYSVGSAPSSPTAAIDAAAFPARFVIDDMGHGTGVASVAAGYRHGACPECLLVVIEGTEEGVRWAASQPWIDVISNSYGPLASLPVGNSDDASRLAYRAGQSVLYSAGNGYSGVGLAPDRNPSFTRPGSGPSWVITVGAASPRNDADHTWHGVPVDVVSYGSAYPAAAHLSVAGQQTFSGTSCATPITAGVEGALLLHARRLLGDVREGPRGAALMAQAEPNATLPATGPLADGTLTRDELEAVLLKTAIPTALDPLATAKDPTTQTGSPASFVFEGYGLVNAKSRAAGVAVLQGDAPLPERPLEDAWMRETDALRDLVWGAP